MTFLTSSRQRGWALACVIGALSLTALWPATARAQTAAETDAVPWQSLSADQQRLLGRFEANWDQFPAQRQQALARGSARFLEMTPDEKRQARERFARWRGMNDNQRRMVRQRWQVFARLTPDQQDAVRAGFLRFKQMSPERKRQLREAWRTATPDERRRMLEILRRQRAQRAPIRRP